MRTDLHAGRREWLKLGLAGALLAACVAAPLAAWRHAQAGWRDQHELLREREERLASLSAENQRLSNLVERAKGHSATGERLREVLKLRGEIGQLRRIAGEVDQLRALNQRLITAATDSARQPAGPPPEAAILAHWPKAQLAFAGYAEPASALARIFHSPPGFSRFGGFFGDKSGWAAQFFPSGH